MNPPKGIFAAAKGETALDGSASQRNSPFTESFKEHIRTPGKHVMTILPSVAGDLAKKRGRFRSHV